MRLFAHAFLRDLILIAGAEESSSKRLFAFRWSERHARRKFTDRASGDLNLGVRYIDKPARELPVGISGTRQARLIWGLGHTEWSSWK